MLWAPARRAEDLVIAVSPFERPDADVVLAAIRGGSLGVLDLGRDARRARGALRHLETHAKGPFGVRVPAACPIHPAELPPAVETVILAEVSEGIAAWRRDGRRLLVEARSLAEARAAVEAGADGIVARGSEGGGRVGEESTFVLLQRLLQAVEVPVWAAGGIGVHSAAAAVAGGAAGVVLDAQLALTRESTIPPSVVAAVSAMDGSETIVVGGHRVYSRPDLPVSALLGTQEPSAVAARIGADDLHEQLLPAGQEAAFAATLAARWPSAGTLVHGVRREITDHLLAARRVDPVAPGSPLAIDLGLRYPIAQGPMTRVSDRAEFAAAVADAGGLPFLALSLMSGAESRALLEETADRMAGRPFGAGILGFVPPEVHDHQLEAIHAVRPPVALIAGGRPSQSRSLEEVGIATYLHVPSPGLLRRFLADGARRFVFEGHECGGHVGPRSSFALWDAQVQTLLASEVADEVSVLFAGGIHDARSAAMVGALAAPLAVRGARIGVLMGTAYLFTHEAVASGAIMAGFQREALACDDTVLLETAPGHTTRCASTAYVRAFEEERNRLRELGTDPQEMWAALEVLNLGRLRMASKGLAREGDELISLTDGEQQREGMFMLGQVAALRTSTGTIAELHGDVSAGSSAILTSAAAMAEERASANGSGPVSRTDVAIIGMACVFPGALDAEGYWSNVVRGVDAVTEVPKERWDPSLYYDPEAVTKGAGRRTPSKWGGFLPDVPFDALAYGIPPRSLAAIEPVQLLSLEVAAQALTDAGYGRGEIREFDRSRVSVVFGAESGTDLASAYGFRALAPQYLGAVPESLEPVLPELTEDSFPGVLTNVIAGRIANRLDLGGVNYTVDAACASSLAALDVAVKELRAGSSDMVLCGGADLHNGINDYLLFSAVHALSPNGRCASFDAEADGIALGEGVACVVLKRLEDAERDGDRIYAVVRSVAGSSDGRSMGLTAPRPEGQRLALERAYAQAGISPAEVGLLEAHGTGTVAGDRTELSVLTELFDEAGAEQQGCALGSVKSQLGHTKCTAGLAGLIKAAQAIHRGVLPPTIHLEHPNAGYDPDKSPFVFHTVARPWLAERRVAGVSAFGFGGTNFHAVLCTPEDSVTPPPAHALEQWPSELFVFRGEEVSDAAALVERVRAHAASEADRPVARTLRDLAAATAAAGSGAAHAAIVADDLDDLLGKLDEVSRRLVKAAGTGSNGTNGSSTSTPGVFLAGPSDLAHAGSVAFLFPGQGSQRPGMLSELFVAFPALRRHLKRGSRWAGTMLPPTAFTDEERREQVDALTDTSVAQPALGMADLAAADLLASVGISPAMAAGHSYGELVALALARVLPEEDLLELSAARAEAILAAAGADPGGMAAVAASADRVRELLGPGSGVVVANENGPRQVVISGPVDELEEAARQLGGAGLAVRRIPVACAFHSPVVAGATSAFAERLAASPIGRARFPVWSNTTTKPYPEDPDAVRSILATQLAEPVRFHDQILAMYEAGARIFVEVGPGTVLSGLVGHILSGRPHRAVPIAAAKPGGSDLRTLLHALGELAVLGVSMDEGALFTGRTRPFDLDLERPPVPGWVVNGHLVRTTDGRVVPGALPPADVAVGPVLPGWQPPMGQRAAVAPPSAAGIGVTPGGDVSLTAVDPRTATVLEYLRGVREAVAAGREVVLNYLGASNVPSLQPGHSASAPLVVVEPTPLAAPAPTPTPSVHDVVLAVVSERTGYPIEMLDAKLDLEADLSIDSIKRLEIVSELAERVGLAGATEQDIEDSVIEELVALKTLEALVDWLQAASAPGGGAAVRIGDADDEQGAEVAGQPPAGGATSNGHDHSNGVGRAKDQHNGSTGAEVPDGSLRFLPRLSEQPPATGSRRIDGLTISVTDDGRGIATALEPILQAAGASVRVVLPGEPLGRSDVLVHLSELAPDASDGALGLFERLREGVAAGVTSVLGVSASGGLLGMGGARPEDMRHAGMRGVMKAVAQEFPALTVRLVDIEGSEEPDDAAAIVAQELLDESGALEVGRRRQTRTTVVFVEHAPVGAPGPELVVSSDSVVLLTGGARGITARVALALAKRWHCHFVLAGRSAESGPEEDPDVAGAGTLVELRHLLGAQGDRRPQEIDTEACRILAAREIRSTLSGIRDSGATAEYRCVDVRDAAAVRSLVEAIYEDHGRLDGVIHGAGVLEDRRLLDKSADSFNRVFHTKVAGAKALAGAVTGPLRFFVLFGSVSGVFGNRGQVDYAAANDALSAFARSLDDRTAERVVVLQWGPWGGGGMVSAELEREFARRGVGMLDPDDAIERLIDELRPGAQEPEVIVMRARPERFGRYAEPWPNADPDRSDPILAGHAAVEVGAGR